MSAATVSPDLQVSVAQRRPKLVLDPWLCLNPFGPSLIQKLQAHSELWLVREFWHILDNSHYFTQDPHALWAAEGAAPSGKEYRALFARGASATTTATGNDSTANVEQLRSALQFWDGLRLSNDLLGLKLFWLGDGLSESLLPEGSSAQLHPRHERWVEWLDGALAPRSPMQCAQRDALALALALGDVPILSTVERASEVVSMAQWLGITRVPCEQIAERDELLGMERHAWKSLLVRANCAPLVWSGLRLVLLHASSAMNLEHDSGMDAETPVSPTPFSVSPPRVFWYAL